VQPMATLARLRLSIDSAFGAFQRAEEKPSRFRLRTISENGLRFIARDFHELIRVRVDAGPHVALLPQSNGELEGLETDMT